MKRTREIFDAFVFIGKHLLPPPRALLGSSLIFLTRISIKLEGEV